MAFDFKQKNKTSSKAAAKEEFVKSQFWLNVGYSVNHDGKDTFVSLPLGIPLDNQKVLPTNSSNAEFAALQAARNNLYEQLMEAVEKLEPDQEEIIELQVQVRRVKEDSAPIDPNKNPFVQNLFG